MPTEDQFAALNEEAEAAFRRTRPWMVLLGVVSIVAAVFCLVLVLAGVLGLSKDRAAGTVLISGGIVGAIILAVLAGFQLAYAGALAGIENAEGAARIAALELACVRQYRLWVAGGVIAALSTLGGLGGLLLRLGHG